MGIEPGTRILDSGRDPPSRPFEKAEAESGKDQAV